MVVSFFTYSEITSKKNTDDSALTSQSTIFAKEDPWAMSDFCNDFSIKGRALKRAIEQNKEDVCHFHDLRVAHIHKLYDKNGEIILNEGPTLGLALKQRDQDMYHHLNRIQTKRQKMQEEMMYLALDQQSFDNKYTFYGERLVDVVKRIPFLHGRLCKCFLRKFSKTKDYQCKVCDITADVLTTIAKPDHVTKVGNIYLVAFNAARMLQICGRQGLKCNLAWTEIAAIAWFACYTSDGLCHKAIDNLMYVIPLSEKKKICVDGKNDKYKLVDTETQVAIDLQNVKMLRRLQEKCRAFGNEVSALHSECPYFLPDFFCQYSEKY